MNKNKVKKNKLLNRLSIKNNSSFDNLISSLENIWCGITWSEGFDVVGKIYIMGNHIKIVSSENENIFIRINMIQSIMPLTMVDKLEADKRYFECVFKSSWDN